MIPKNLQFLSGDTTFFHGMKSYNSIVCQEIVEYIWIMETG